MEIIITDSPQLVAERSANLIQNLIDKNPHAVLGLATGSTPVALYEKLIELYKNKGLSFKDVTTFNLDEYVGLDPEHRQSYRYFMNDLLFSHLDINIENTHLPDGMKENPMESGPEYEGKIKKAGGIDFQVLGIGANSHIGFNEPTSSLGSRTRIKTLTQKTMKDNSRFFKKDEFQPYLAVTMGISTIMESRKIILLATGRNKADAVKNTVEGPVTSVCPASALQWHPNTTVIVDLEAAEKLEYKDYYKFVLREQDKLVQRFGNPKIP